MYKITFIVGHNNKCHIYRSVGALKIIMLYMFKHFLDNKNMI